MRSFFPSSVSTRPGFHILRGWARRIGLSVLIAGSLASLGFAVEDGGQAASDKWADHPALQNFDLAGKELPSGLFLVRTRGELPPADGVVVHGAYNRMFLVSGDPTSVTGLARRGCAVIPLRDLPAAPKFPARQWAPVDTPDTTIAAMVSQVNWAGISSKIQWAVDFGTRYSYASNHSDVADSIGAVFASYGLTPVKQSFRAGGPTMYNVEATQTGTVYPDSFYILCGHFDSISEDPEVSAPGADDNGTGVATVLTAAEILTQYEFEYSIRYICFAGEEQGLFGSKYYARWAAQNNVGIVGVLNFDMMGYWVTGVPKDLEIETNHASQWLAAAILNAADLYTATPYELHVDDGAWWGDHASFWDEGFAAVNHEEAWDWYDPDFNPYYHTTNDLLAHVDSGFTVGNVQIGVASLATLAGLIPAVTGIDDRVSPPTFAASLSAYPNPFSGRINFTVADLPGHDRTRVLIYDARGRRVGVVPVVLQDGQGIALWNVNNGATGEIGSGVYFAKLEGFPDAVPVKIVYLK